MKVLNIILVLCITTSCSTINEQQFSYINHSLDRDQIYLADPTIFYHNEVYYLYGTADAALKDIGEGFIVYTSKDLKKWNGPIGKSNGLALQRGDAFGTKGFWAPQVFKYRDKFYMAYTADEKIAMATSDNLLGPFKSIEKEPIEANVKQIDPFIFFDTDGKKYLYHVRLTEGNRIFVAELEDDLLQIKQETLKECIAANLNWENTAATNWPVVEGPTVLKHKELYYLIYSANDFRNPYYAVGYATAKSPFGPWEKSKFNPILHKNRVSENGTGHGDIFFNKNGRLQYVLHTHLSNEKVNPRKTVILDIEFKKDVKSQHDKLEVGNKSFRFLKF
ncbi:glycoside hydrolase family 43 protein [Gelidibacter mesophilus]|uniref:glycoside hydrolase family 43 protein n=1 Tax=Gelidibacter mesophilus TaxID=169050 RepID=UPI000480FFBB|nr:glycoside hydrolase family 43 protein [Gelidibacter mesophilus]